MRNYNGKEPCPGCGLPEPRTTKNELCHKCKNLLRLGKGVVENSDGFSTIQIARYNLDRLELIDMKDKERKQTKSTPGCSYVSDMVDATQGGSSKHVRNTLKKFLQTINEGVKSKTEFSVYMSESSWDDSVTVKTATAKAFYEFYEALSLYTKQVDKLAFERGHSLLVGLNDGSISMDNFSERIKRKS